MPETKDPRYTLVHLIDHQQYHTDLATAKLLHNLRQIDRHAYSLVFDYAKGEGRIEEGAAPLVTGPVVLQPPSAQRLYAVPADGLKPGDILAATMGHGLYDVLVVESAQIDRRTPGNPSYRVHTADGRDVVLTTDERTQVIPLPQQLAYAPDVADAWRDLTPADRNVVMATTDPETGETQLSRFMGIDAAGTYGSETLDHSTAVQSNRWDAYEGAKVVPSILSDAEVRALAGARVGDEPELETDGDRQRITETIGESEGVEL